MSLRTIYKLRMRPIVIQAMEAKTPGLKPTSILLRNAGIKTPGSLRCECMRITSHPSQRREGWGTHFICLAGRVVYLVAGVSLSA
jgi:hypothetical protein